jgi:acyl carrier protein
VGIEQALIGFIQEMVLGPQEAPLTADEQLLDGRLDSLSVLRLVGFIEERFQIRVADDELVPENFATVESIAQYVQAKTGAER